MQTETGRERPVAGPLGSRVALVCRLLLDALPSVIARDRPASVLDCGGGSGAYAVPLALAGAEVTVVDISADALATLNRRAAEAGVSDSVQAVAADVESSLDDALGPLPFDLVLAHGVLDSVEQVSTTFAGIAARVRPGGLLSVVVANPSAAVLARALAGEPALALIELRELAASGGGAADPHAITALCEQHGLVIEARYGIGAFSDLVPRSVPGSALDAPAARDALAQLDLEAAERPPFADLAGRIHLLARRPAG